MWITGLCIIFQGFDLFAQQDSINLFEIKIQKQFNALPNTPSTIERARLNDTILFLFEKVLQLDKSFFYPFDSLKNIGKLESDDRQLKIYTWNLPLENGKHNYFGYIQYYNKNLKKYQIFQLRNNPEAIENADQVIFDYKHWQGALYYEIVTVKKDGKTYYTLLGFDFNDIFTSKKIIEVLSFNELENPEFGAPLFQYEKPQQTRIIFEYSSRASMSLRYDAKRKMIVFDHLSPSQPSYEGKFRFYGPDFSYDGLRFENGFWQLQKNINITN